MSQDAYTDDIDAAKAEAERVIETTATAQGWSSEDTGAALDDVAAARAAASWIDAFVAADVGESVGEQQVETFWRDLAARAASWMAPGADGLRSWLASASGLAASDAGGTSTPADYLSDGADVAAESAQDLRDVGAAAADTARRVLSPGVLFGAAALVLVLVLASSPRVAR